MTGADRSGLPCGLLWPVFGQGLVCLGATHGCAPSPSISPGGLLAARITSCYDQGQLASAPAGVRCRAVSRCLSLLSESPLACRTASTV